MSDFVAHKTSLNSPNLHSPRGYPVHGDMIAICPVVLHDARAIHLEHGRTGRSPEVEWVARKA